MGDFRFKMFTVHQDASALKVGTDAVLLGASMTVLSSDRQMLDIGTGTGVIALMAAQRCPTAMIEAIDIDEPSASEAACNFAGSPWADRLCAVCVPLQDYSPSVRYDLVFSNPPFYDNSLTNPDERETTARHTGSLSHAEICAFAADHLAENGRLSVILPSDVQLRFLRTAASFGLHPFRIVSIRTTRTKAPKRVILEFSRIRGNVETSELTLQDGSSRSAEYSFLTEDFYL